MARRVGAVGLAALTVLAVAAAGLSQGNDAVPAAPEGFALDGDAAVGKALFLEKCATCHGRKGKGNGRIKTDPPPRDLTDPARMHRRSDWEIYLVIRDGGKVLGLSSKMFPWGKLLSEQETLDLATYVRTLSKESAAASADAAAG